MAVAQDASVSAYAYSMYIYKLGLSIWLITQIKFG